MHTITAENNIVCVRVSGKLTQDDYDELIPSWKAAIARYGKMRLLFIMEDFHGWDVGAAWDDFRFDRKHGGQIERVAMVGEKAWQHWITKLGAVFADTTVRYFERDQLNEAERWVRSE